MSHNSPNGQLAGIRSASFVALVAMVRIPLEYKYELTEPNCPQINLFSYFHLISIDKSEVKIIIKRISHNGNTSIDIDPIHQRSSGRVLSHLVEQRSYSMEVYYSCPPPSQTKICASKCKLTWTYSSRGICKTLEDTRTWMSALLVETNPDIEVYAIILKEPENNNKNNIIGVIGTHKTDPIPELSYILHPSAWGKGYATEALREYSQQYFGLKPQFDRLTAWVDTENAGSIKVLRKCGFVEEKMERGDYVIPWKSPAERDSFLYVLKKNF